MLIFIEGSDSFLARQAINQIKKKYLEKNPDGVELTDVDCDPSTPLRASWADLQAVPLFATSRLVILRRVGVLSAAEQDSLASYLSALPSSTVAVVWNEKALPKGALAEQLSRAAKQISAQPLAGAGLAKYLDKRAKELGVALSSAQRSGLLGDFAGNLWGLETELAVLELGGQIGPGKGAAVEPFALYRAVQAGRYQQAAELIRREQAAGTPTELLIGSIASALRKGKPTEVIDAVELLADVDIGLKTGLLDGDQAAAVLAARLAQTGEKRVEWEQLWEETQGG